jgi:hypothetical protein
MVYLFVACKGAKRERFQRDGDIIKVFKTLSWRKIRFLLSCKETLLTGHFLGILVHLISKPRTEDDEEK